MKIMVSLCLSVLIATLVLSCLPVNGEEALYDNMIRLHVIARSDSDAHQAEKLIARDAVLSTLADRLRDSHNYRDALAGVTALLPEIEQAAAEAIGGACGVRLELGSEHYPVRCYDSFTLPAGEYTSLRVILGEGEGQNWWCVLFPRLCTAQASEDGFYEDFIAAGFSAEQYHLIKNESGVKYKIRFRILEILRELTP